MATRRNPRRAAQDRPQPVSPAEAVQAAIRKVRAPFEAAVAAREGAAEQEPATSTNPEE